MCKLTKQEQLRQIARDNTELINRVIKYINIELNIDLYKEYNNNININTSNSLIKEKSFYKQVINRLLNQVERHSFKEAQLLSEIEKGDKLLAYKKAATVQSPNYGEEASFNNGYRPNTQEAKLLDIVEEAQKQQERILKYELFKKSFDDNKEMVKDFILLARNVKAAEVIVKHYLEQKRYCDIAKEMLYEEVYYLSKRGIDELAIILKESL